MKVKYQLGKYECFFVCGIKYIHEASLFSLKSTNSPFHLDLKPLHAFYCKPRQHHGPHIVVTFTSHPLHDKHPSNTLDPPNIILYIHLDGWNIDAILNRWLSGEKCLHCDKN